MKNSDVNEKSLSEKIRSNLSKAELKKVQSAKDKKGISDDEIFADLDKVNTDSLTKKSAKNRSIWTEKAKSDFSDNEKTARRKIRSKQMRISKDLLRELKVNKSVENARKFAKELQTFYKNSLVDFSVYSNISETENPIGFSNVHTAYIKMKQLLNI